MSLFDDATLLIDTANSADRRIENADGDGVPRELLYSPRMTAGLDRLEPEAGEALKLAVRAQHLRRWEIRRDTYPMGRAGYHAWRRELAVYHAEKAGELLAEAGYDGPMIARVQSLIRKENLRSDPETQTLEDVACLVFLEHYFEHFLPQQDAAKVIEIVRKTWRKMSPRGQAAALELELAPEAQELVEKALGKG